MNEYRIVHDRAAVDLTALQLPFSNDHARALLAELGFEILKIDLVERARSLIGKVSYDFKAKRWYAPTRVNCFTFTRWVYGQLGIWIPRLSTQQFLLGRQIEREEVVAGDLMFWNRPISKWYSGDEEHAVGHVSIATGQGSMVHAVKRYQTVIETPFERTWRKFQGACRIIENPTQIITLVCPRHFEIDTSDDIKWLLLEENLKAERVVHSLAQTA